MKINWHVYFGAFCLLLIGIQTSLAQVKQGVLILASAEGQISFQDASGNPAKKVNPGEPIPPEHFLITGRGAKVIGLLSNGTLMTIGENTRMRVATFEQEPFEDKGGKISDLPTEPSKSKVILDLDTGSLILKTKKLNKESTLKINSPLGFAGIRGTEFQMASNPGQGVQLDVTESTVEFTPPGGGPPIAVSEGSGLSAPPGVAPTLRPVNPTVARKIEVSNQAATDATQDVSLEQVSTAMEQVAVEDETDTTDNSSPSSEEEDASEAESDSELEEADSAEAEEQEMIEAEETNEFEEDAQSGNRTDRIHREMPEHRKIRALNLLRIRKIRTPNNPVVIPSRIQVSGIMKISQENRQHQKIPLNRGVKRLKRDGLPGMPLQKVA